jgi:hypothetical protein
VLTLLNLTPICWLNNKCYHLETKIVILGVITCALVEDFSIG